MKVKLQAAVQFDQVGAELRALGIVKRPSEQKNHLLLFLDAPDPAYHSAVSTLAEQGFTLVKASTQSYVTGRQPDAAAPPCCGRRGHRRLPGAVAIACGLGGSRLTSLVHGWTTEPEVGRVRHRSAHQLRCHFGCADASALAQEGPELAT